MTEWVMPALAGRRVPCQLWDPADIENRVEAHLIWESGGSLHLQAGPADITGTPTLLHGQTDSGQQFTIPRAWCIDQITRLDIKAQNGIIAGPHLHSPEHPFSALRIRISGLSQLADWPFETSLAAGGTLRLHESESGQWFEISDLEPRSQQLLDRTFVVPLLSLAKLALSGKSELLEMQVQETNATDWRGIYRGPVPGPDTVAGPLLSQADLTAAVVANWLNRVESFDSIPAVVAGLVGPRDVLALESTVLQLTTAAEGLSRRLNLQDRMTLEEAKAIQLAAVEGARQADPDRGQIVESYLNHLHEPSFPQRLADLADRANAAVPGITGNAKKWKALVYGARNDFAHRARKGWLTADAIERYSVVAFSLPWVLRIVLLAEAGVPAEVLQKRTAASDTYRTFINNCATYQHGPYAPAT